MLVGSMPHSHSCLRKASSSLHIFTALVHVVLTVSTGCLEGRFRAGTGSWIRYYPLPSAAT